MDDRAETFQAAIGSWEYYLAYSSAALIREENLVGRLGPGGELVEYELAPSVSTLGEYAGLCENERFREQPVAAFCSATLVAPDLVLTAGHCLIPEQVASAEPGEALDAATGCDSLMIAFDFAYKNPTNAFNGNVGAIPASSVYRCKTIEALGFVQQPSNIDWALVRLDRAVPNRDPMPMLPILPKTNAPILQIGHPSGIPQKLAAGLVTNRYDFPYGEIFEGNSFIYIADLFGGNSGGGVFDMSTGAVAGVPTVYSGQNFVFDDANQCSVFGVCGVNVTCAFPPGAFGTAKMREFLINENPALLQELTFVEVEDEGEPRLVVSITPDNLDIKTEGEVSMSVSLNVAAGSGGQVIDIVSTGDILTETSVTVEPGEFSVDFLILVGSTVGPASVTASIGEDVSATAQINIIDGR